MIIVLERGITEKRVEAIFSALESNGVRGRLLESLDKPLIHVVEGSSRLARGVQSMDGVVGLIPTPGPRIREKGRFFFPYHSINWFSIGLAVLGLLVFLAGFLPPGVGVAIDRLGPLPESTLPWYMRAPHALMVHAWGRLTLLALGLLLFLLPAIDRSRTDAFGARIPVLAAAALLLSGWLFLTLT